MRRRLYFVLPNILSARQTMNDLLLARIEERHIHSLAREDVPLAGLHEANLLHKTDIVHGAELGLLVGAAAGAVLGIIAVLSPPKGMDLQLVTVLITALLGGLFGAWGARPGGGGGTQRAVAPTLVQGGEAGEGAGEVEIDEVEQAAGDGGGAGVGRDGGAQAIGHPGEEAQGGGWLREGVKEHLLDYKLVYVRLQGKNLGNLWHARRGFGQ